MEVNVINTDGIFNREDRDVDVGTQAPLFLLSFKHRDDLALAASRAGWQAIAARRAQNAEQRFISCGAMVAVVDARGAYDEGLAAVRALADAAEINDAALVVIVSRRDVARLDSFINAGATHYLAGPFSQAEFGQNLRFAERYSLRLGGSRQNVDHGRHNDQGGSYAWQWNLAKGMVTLSEAFARRISSPSRERVASELIRQLGGDDLKAARQSIRQVLKDGRPTAFTHTLISETGQDRVAQHLRYDQEKRVLIGMIEILSNDRSPKSDVNRDALTGLSSLAGARQWITSRLASARHFRVMIIAITRFEMINNAFGRETGDHLLQGVARTIDRLVGDIEVDSKLVSRTAGADFIIGLGGDMSDQAVLELAERIAGQIERPTLSEAHLVTLSSRIAIIGRLDGDNEANHILRRASAEIAEAKNSDLGRIRLVTAADQSFAERNLSLQTDLRSALDRGEIELLFQPQVAISTGEVVGVEALARWRHPAHGELGAVTLFAVAEQSDYLLALSAHVQKRALEQAAAWPDTLANVRLAINVTSADIARPGFAALFLEMVDASGFPRSRLTVEVTESGLIEDLGVAAELLAALRAGGCRVAIDDFGTGYSSLAYLKALPLDYLKIDKKLAQDIAGSARDRVVVRGVIDMARSLGLAVIAEGVETEQQLALLAREGCNYYQGFLCAQPLEVAALERLVREQHHGVSGHS